METMTVNNLGNNLLVEDCSKIAVADLIREYRIKLKESFLTSQLEMMSVNVRLTTSQTGNKGTRFWFVCPKCERRVGLLLRHPLQGTIGCRLCLNLEYRKRRYKGMIEGK